MDLLDRQRLENHKMWDSQILGLSTLILALSLTALDGFIDYSNSSYKYLLVSSWIFLWATIVTSILNFYVAENSQVKWKLILVKMTRHFQNIGNLRNQLDKKLQELELTKNLTEFKKARENGIAKINDAIDEYEDSIKPMNDSHGRWNRSIYILNNFKTIFFILAITTMVLYVLLNLELASHNQQINQGLSTAC